MNYRTLDKHITVLISNEKFSFVNLLCVNSTYTSDLFKTFASNSFFPSVAFFFFTGIAQLKFF